MGVELYTPAEKNFTSCHSERAWVLDPPEGMKVAVVLSEAMDLCSYLCFDKVLRATAEIVRSAQDDSLSRERGEESRQLQSGKRLVQRLSHGQENPIQRSGFTPKRKGRQNRKEEH